MKKFIFLLFCCIYLISYSQQKNGISVGTTISTINMNQGPFSSDWIPGFYVELTSRISGKNEKLFLRPSLGFSREGTSLTYTSIWVTPDGTNDPFLPPESFIQKILLNKIYILLDIEYSLDNFINGLAVLAGVNVDYLIERENSQNSVGVFYPTSSMSIRERTNASIDLGVNYNLGLASVELKYALHFINFGSLSATSYSVPHVIKIGLLYFI